LQHKFVDRPAAEGDAGFTESRVEFAAAGQTDEKGFGVVDRPADDDFAVALDAQIVKGFVGAEVDARDAAGSEG
jgi:hypothetical protein